MDAVENHFIFALTKWSNHSIKVMKLSTDTERKILDAARQEFEKKGYNGTRMQVIADEAGISKASLHYYFRSKDNLFEKIFTEAMDEYVPLIITWMDDQMNWEEKVKQFTHDLIEFIRKGRMLFLIREINRNPDLLAERIKKAKSGNRIVLYFDEVQKAQQIQSIDTRYLYILLNSICCFPSMNQPMFQQALRLSPKQYDELMKGYAETAAQFFIQAIKKTVHV